MDKEIDKKPFVLALSGLDPSGKAGLLRDVSVINSLDAIAGGIPTAITVQDFERAYEWEPIDGKLFEHILRKLFANRCPDAIKVGMVPNVKLAAVIENEIRKIGIPVVWDPVIATSDGTSLMNPDEIDDIMNVLSRVVTVITPNIPEAERFWVGKDGKLNENLLSKKVSEYGMKAILLKGGHSSGEYIKDCLVTGSGTQYYQRFRLDKNIRGTGCALASALATELAAGKPIDKAFMQAEKFMDSFIASAS